MIFLSLLLLKASVKKSVGNMKAFIVIRNCQTICLNLKGYSNKVAHNVRGFVQVGN
jgi:hypothetical protein